MEYKITKTLAYEIGVHIGDGNIYAKDRTYKITYSGNLENEETYYLEVLYPIIEKLFNITPSIYKIKKKNVILLVINSKRVADFKINKLNLPNGKKNHIKIPYIILKDNALLLDCLKGIGDTDFSLSFKKNRMGLYNQPRIELFQRSAEISIQLHQILLSLGFTAALEQNIKRRGYTENRLRMYGKRNLYLWMEKIGFLNPYRLLKFNVWEQLNNVPPYQNYNDLLKLLNSQ